ncbi:hemin-degrading factor [Stenoxybacter acetivorans]|uniref:hemin-degrading factor n=1 Tax=Stenoxybacter acetivorans TaxID=422441 RepID=UPI000560810C|nr:hemin-degrading factor [Stenoxybacter acetivorans]
MTLWQQYLGNKQTAGQYYFPREGAAALCVSEGELVADSPNTQYLGCAIRDIVLKLHTLGTVKSIVRNGLAVHEKQGVYENVSLSSGSGLSLNIGGLDLRFFPQHWHHALAVSEPNGNRISHSIQFYDDYGTALQKVFLCDESKLPEWQILIDAFRVEGKPEFKYGALPMVIPAAALTPEREPAFQERWQELKDVHHFVGLLENFQLDRQQSYRHAPHGSTQQLDNGIWETVLHEVHDSGMELMIFVGNRGLVQIQTGAVHKIVRTDSYLNILDSKTEGFNLHLKDDEITETWVVRRPIRDGFVTCIEGFDDRRKTVIQFFGRRQEGETELAAWQKITNQLLNKASLG